VQAHDFDKARMPGRLVPGPAIGKTPAGAYVAFDPDPLPPKLAAADLAGLLRGNGEAERAIGRLAGVGAMLPNPHLLIGPFMRREAVLSSRIEGTQASLSELLLFEAAAPSVPRGGGDVVEVANYVKSLVHGLQRVEKLALGQKLICELHERLMIGVRGGERRPGEFRDVPNWIGADRSPVTEAVFVPPPPAEMQRALDALESYLHAPSDLPPLLRLAAIHYQFETIHPFEDGNGRIGRLLITLLLCVERLLPEPMLYLSAFFEKNRAEYYDRLRDVSLKGRWAEWFDFFLRGVREQAEDGIERANRLLRLREDYRARLHAARASALLFQLVDALFESPATSVLRAAERLGVTRAGASINIEKLVAAKILVESTGRKRNRIFLAGEILEVVEGA
jgi:Fic family protein